MDVDPGCSGFVACAGLASCGSYAGCTEDSSCDGLTSRDTCEGAGCLFSCGGSAAAEICSNRVDDNYDGLVDCEDPDCQVTVVGVPNADVSRYNCLGTNQTGNLSLSWYCGVAQNDESVGLCCGGGDRPLEILGVWQCVDNDPCDPSSPISRCSYNYSSQFVDWIDETGVVGVDPSWCVAPLDGRACCPVVHFGSDEYWDDAGAGNVVVY